MGIAGKVVAISCGVFVGGGLGFLLRETIGKNLLESKKLSLVDELEELKNEKQLKQKELQKRTQQ
jgi:hypothetical protein